MNQSHHNLDQRQLGTVLAALRLYQEHAVAAPNSPSPRFEDIASDGGTLQPLNADEIDELCEMLNG